MLGTTVETHWSMEKDLAKTDEADVVLVCLEGIGNGSALSAPSIVMRSMLVSTEEIHVSQTEKAEKL